MAIVAEFIGSDDARWKATLDQVRHDFYHLPEYVRFTAGYEGGTAIAFWAQDGESTCLIPFLQRPLPECLEAPSDWTDVCSPYGYPSPLLTNEVHCGLDHFLPTFLDMGKQLGIVSAFLRLHPLLPISLKEANGFGEVVEHGQTVYIDLRQPNEEIWRQTRKNHRSGINKLVRAGFEANINDWALVRDFKNLYRATMKRVGAAEYYHFSDEYFDGLKAALGAKLNLCSVLAPTGEVAAAGLFSSCNGLVEFHLAGTCEKFLGLAPTKLMFDFVRRWGKDLGDEIFHLGGGVGAEDDPLYHFKAGFSEQRSPFYTFRLITDPLRYSELNRRLQKKRGGDALDEGSFFPRYRQGL